MKGKTSGDFASLFSGGTPPPEAEVGFTVGKRFLFTRSHFDSLTECQVTTAKKLKDDPKLSEGVEKDFIGVFKKNRIPKLQKELNGKLDELKQTLAEEARRKGLSDVAARGLAASITPEYVEDEVARRAEAEGREQLAQLRATPDGLKQHADARALAHAIASCAEEDQTLVRRVTLDWLSFRVTYNHARYKILNEEGAFADQVRKQDFDGYSATVAYNALLTFSDVGALGANREARMLARVAGEKLPEKPKGVDGSMILGVSLGVKRTNNSDDLDSIEVEDQSFTSSSRTTQRRALSKQTVLSGLYKEFIAVPLNTDVVFYPGSFRGRIAIDVFTRSNLGSTNRKFVPGVGMFITQEGKPTKVVRGISFAYDDGKARIGLVGGFHF